MSLRFTQTLLPSAPGRELVPAFEMARRVEAVEPPLRGGQLALDHGPELVRGAGLLLGRRPAALVGVTTPSALDEVLELAEEGRVRAPKWLDGTFRPRHLTRVGAEFLESLNPSKVDPILGVSLVREEPWSSLEQRMEHLQRKYLALDMVAKRIAIEVEGRLWPIELANNAYRAHANGPFARRSVKDYGPLELNDALIWLGAYQEASWDQLRSLHPSHQLATDHLLQVMLDQGLVESREVRLGLGQLHTLRLSERGLEILKASEGGREMIRRGFGPRKTGRGIGEYHEQAVGDAIGFFAHEVQEAGGHVTGLTLESSLRREYLGAQHVPDLRVEFTSQLGASHWDVEVLGAGWQSYSKPRRTQKLAASPMTRAFDPKGRNSGPRALDVRVSR